MLGINIHYGKVEGRRELMVIFYYGVLATHMQM